MTLRGEIDITDRLRLMVIEREFYTKTGKPMHVNAKMTDWLTEAGTEIEQLRGRIGELEMILTNHRLHGCVVNWKTGNEQLTDDKK